MDEGNEGNEGSEERETVSPAASDTPTEPSQGEMPAYAPPAGIDSWFPTSSSLSPPSDDGSPGTEPSTLVLAGTGAPAPSRRPNPRTVAVALAAVVLIAALVGFGSVLHHRHHQASPATSVPATSISDTTSTSTSLAAESTGSIVRQLDPAVVDVNTINQTDTGYAIAAATGMIVSSDGYIVTNNHVVEEATRIRVAIEGHSTQYKATFVGADPAADVAVIKVDGLTGLPTVHLGNSSTVSVGDRVVAIGNAHGLGGTPAVTTGTIQQLGRSITATDDITTRPEHLTGMIETSATIQPGNSGGPLVDDHAEVIGMNTAADPGGALGYALPIDRVRAIAGAIEDGRSGAGITLGLRAFLGVVGQPPASGSTPAGVHITRIVLGDPAAEGGVEPGDVIVDFDGTPTPSVFVLQRLVLARNPGDVATVTYQSPNGLETTTVRLVKGPAP
jgi:S1-C subfamily serine protease